MHLMRMRQTGGDVAPAARRRLEATTPWLGGAALHDIGSRNPLGRPITGRPTHRHEYSTCDEAP